jgi:hypothetical protein
LPRPIWSASMQPEPGLLLTWFQMKRTPSTWVVVVVVVVGGRGLVGGCGGAGGWGGPRGGPVLDGLGCGRLRARAVGRTADGHGQSPGAASGIP